MGKITDVHKPSDGNTEYGLNASIFSSNVSHARRLARKIKSGTVNINEGYAVAYSSQGAPMGGMKLSGLGRRHGPAAIMKYVEPQTIARQRIIGFDPSFGMSPRRYAQVFTAAMRLLKTMRIR